MKCSTHTLVVFLSIFLQDWEMGYFIALWFGHCKLDYVISKLDLEAII